MTKVIKLNESDIQRIVKRVLTEQEEEWGPNAGWEGKTYYDQDETGNIIDDEGRILKVWRNEDPDMNYHRSRHTDDDSEYDWAHDPWGHLQNPKDNRSYRTKDDKSIDLKDAGDEGFEEVASFDDYDEYVKSGYCHPHDETCMRERAYFDKVVNDFDRPLKIYRRPKKK